MLKAQLSYPRKRRNPEESTLLRDETPRTSKKPKHTHFSNPQYSPAFWDNLSKIDITKRALKELDRRNKQAAWSSNSPGRQLRRPITPRAQAQLEDYQPTHSATQFLCHCGTRALKCIKQFARHGGPDLSNLRSFPKPADPLKQSSSHGPTRGSASTLNSQSTSNTTTSKSTGPYNRNFQQNLIDGGVYPDGYEYPDGQIPAQPANWEEILQRLAVPRRSLSPSTFTVEDFRKFKRADAHASKEKQVTTSVIPIIEGDIGDAKCVSGGIPFTNLDHLMDGTLVPGNPDIYYGARPEQLDRQVRDELSGGIIPSTQDDLPILPNFFLAAKGPDGSAAVAKRQACYDGALGARGMDSLLSYRQENHTRHNAYTFTSTYHDGTLKMYTSNCAELTSPESRPKYYMHQLKGWSMTSDLETFRQGATAYRNARDWAKEQRDETIRQANVTVREHQAATSTVNMSFEESTSFTSEATLDGNYMVEALSPESQALSTEDSNTTINLQESSPPSEEVSLDRRLPTKRSNRNSTERHQSQRKRRIAGDFEYSGSEH